MKAKNTELDLYMLAYHAGVTMQVLAEMVATPLFYHRSAAAMLQLLLSVSCNSLAACTSCSTMPAMQA